MLEIIGGEAVLAAEDAERVRPANSEVFELIADATQIRAQTGGSRRCRCARAWSARSTSSARA